MKNTDFEKYLRDEADAFSMEPGPGAMEKVMDALHKKKKRRGIFLWFLFPALGLGMLFILLRTLPAGKHRQPVSVLHPEQQQPVSSSPSGNTSGNGSAPQTNDVPNSTISETGTQPVVPGNIAGNKPVKQNETHREKTATDVPVNKTDVKTPPLKSPVSHLTSAHTHIETPSATTTADSDNKFLLHSTREQLPTTGLAVTHPGRIDVAVQLPGGFFPYSVAPRVQKPQTGLFYHWSVGAWFRAGATMSRFEEETNAPISQQVSKNYASYRDTNDRFQLSYAAGLSFRYAPVKFLAIETGIGYSRITSNEPILDNTTYALEDSFFPDTTNSVVNGTSSVPPTGIYKSNRNEYSFLTIPLHVYYQNKWKWIGVEAGGGVSFDIPVQTRSYEISGTGNTMVLHSDVASSQLNPVGVSLDLNLNAVFHVNRLSFYAGPVFRYQVNSLYRSTYFIRQQPYFIGGETGVRVNF
jgi:hypothetical protein